MEIELEMVMVTENGDGDGDAWSCPAVDPDALVTPAVCRNEVPKCAWIDPPSIELGEYLPFRWDVEFDEGVDRTAESCDDII